MKHVNTVVRIEALRSVEYITHDDATSHRIFESLWLRMERRQTWGIYAHESYETALLLEIIGNLRPYEDGKCVLMERGMMRKKRVILQHVFFIGSADMLYENMNVLEYLVFVIGYKEKDRVAVQEALFEELLAIGLGDISLTLVRDLDRDERALVILLAAAHAKSSIVIFNLPDIEWKKSLRMAIANIAHRIEQDNRLLIIATHDTALIDEACTHMAYISKGKTVLQGSVRYLRQHLDPYTVILSGGGLLGVAARLKNLMPGYRFALRNGAIYMACPRGESCEPVDLISLIAKTGIIPETIQVNPKSVRNAIEERRK